MEQTDRGVRSERKCRSMRGSPVGERMKRDCIMVRVLWVVHEGFAKVPWDLRVL